MSAHTNNERSEAAVDVPRLVMRKFVLAVSIIWMLPWWTAAQLLRVALCLVVGLQNLWWHPIHEAKDSWDSSA